MRGNPSIFVVIAVTVSFLWAGFLGIKALVEYIHRPEPKAFTAEEIQATKELQEKAVASINLETCLYEASDEYETTKLLYCLETKNTPGCSLQLYTIERLDSILKAKQELCMILYSKK